MASNRLTTKAASEYAGHIFSAYSLRNGRSTGLLLGVPAPEHYTIGGRVYYLTDTIDAWMDTHSVSHKVQHLDEAIGHSSAGTDTSETNVADERVTAGEASKLTAPKSSALEKQLQNEIAALTYELGRCREKISRLERQGETS